MPQMVPQRNQEPGPWTSWRSLCNVQKKDLGRIYGIPLENLNFVYDEPSTISLTPEAFRSAFRFAQICEAWHLKDISEVGCRCEAGIRYDDGRLAYRARTPQGCTRKRIVVGKESCQSVLGLPGVRDVLVEFSFLRPFWHSLEITVSE